MAYALLEVLVCVCLVVALAALVFLKGRGKNSFCHAPTLTVCYAEWCQNMGRVPVVWHGRFGNSSRYLLQVSS